MIVDEAEEELEMADDPFLEAGLPQLPDTPQPAKHIIDMKHDRSDSVSLSLYNASEIAVQMSKLYRNKIEECGVVIPEGDEEQSVHNNDKNVCIPVVKVNGQTEENEIGIMLKQIEIGDDDYSGRRRSSVQ